MPFFVPQSQLDQLRDCIKERVADIGDLQKQVSQQAAIIVKAIEENVALREEKAKLSQQLHDLTLRLFEDNRSMRDSLLIKQGVKPVDQPPPPKSPQILSPLGVTPEATAAIRESWLKEETRYLMGEGMSDEYTARKAAEENYKHQHAAIS